MQCSPLGPCRFSCRMTVWMGVPLPKSACSTRSVGGPAASAARQFLWQSGPTICNQLSHLHQPTGGRQFAQCRQVQRQFASYSLQSSLNRRLPRLFSPKVQSLAPLLQHAPCRIGISHTPNRSFIGVVPMWGRSIAPSWRGVCITTSNSKMQDHQQTRSRHSRSKSIDSLADLAVILSPTELMERAASEILLYTGLAFKLYSYLGLGWKWLFNFYRLVLYAMLLLPGFTQMIYYYFTSEQVHRHVPYGRKPRQQLDLYIPKSVSKGDAVPTVIFVTGGAWTIGYKAWGALLARRLCDAGVITMCLDYRNFPQGNALDMLEDVNTGIAWALRKLERYGGDPEQVWLVGQSAGGQLAMLALLNQAAQAATGEAVWGGAPMWHPQGLAGFVGVSGAYDLEGLAEHLHRRGLYKNLLDSVMTLDGRVAYDQLSPLHAARNAPSGVSQFMPPVLLLHGTTDKSVPVASSLLLNDALQAAGVDTEVHLLPGKTHTDLLLEDALGGGRDVLTDSILQCITDQQQLSNHPSMCPRFLVSMASKVCPF